MSPALADFITPDPYDDEDPGALWYAVIRGRFPGVYRGL
jgi:hypothetical protein